MAYDVVVSLFFSFLATILILRFLPRLELGHKDRFTLKRRTVEFAPGQVKFTAPFSNESIVLYIL